MATNAKSLKKNQAEIPASALPVAIGLSAHRSRSLDLPACPGHESHCPGKPGGLGACISRLSLLRLAPEQPCSSCRGLHEFTPIFAPKSLPKTLFLALAAFIAGGLLITLDLGNPAAVWRLLTSFETSSLMIWDFYLLIVCVIVALVYWAVTRKGQKNTLLGALAMASGLVVVVVEGWMLASLAARPLFGGGLTVISFLVAAAVMGLSLLLLAGIEPQKVVPLAGFGADCRPGNGGGRRRHRLALGGGTRCSRSPLADQRLGCTALLVPNRSGADHPAGADPLEGLPGDRRRSGDAGRAGREKLAAGRWPIAALASPAEQHLPAQLDRDGCGHRCGRNWYAGIFADEEIRALSKGLLR